MVCRAFVLVFIVVNNIRCEDSTDITPGQSGLMTTIILLQSDATKNQREFRECPANYFRNTAGTCIACPPGFQGKSCSESCPDNYYGDMCMLQCYCSVGQICDNHYGCTEINTETTPEDIITSSVNYDNLGISTSYQVYFRYIGGGLALILVITIFGTITMRRSGFKSRVSIVSVQEPTNVEGTLQTITDVNELEEQKTMYSNVYLEIIDIESNNLDPRNIYEDVSRSSSSYSQSNANCGYLDVIAIVEKESCPDAPVASSDEENTEDIQMDDIQVKNPCREDMLSDTYSAGI